MRSTLCVLLLLSSCRAPHPEAAAAQAPLRDEGGDDRARALASFGGLGVQVVPAPGEPEAARAAAKIAAFSARDARLQDVLLSLCKDSDVNLVLDPGVGEQVATFDIKGATLEETFQQVLATYDLAYRFDGSFLRVGARTQRVFDVDFPATAAAAPAASTNSSAQTSGGDGTTEATAGGSAAAAAGFWSSLRTDLAALITGQSDVRLVVNAALGTVMVEGPPSAVQRIETYLARAHRRATRLVSIEARVLEVTLSDALQLGVNWSLFPNFFNTAEQGGVPGGAVIGQSLGTAAEALRIGLIKTDTFAVLVDMLAAQGQVRVLSNPRVSTLSNVPAQIRVVEQVPVIEREIVDSQGTSRTQFAVRFESAGVQVAVTPQVGEDGMIAVHVLPSITEVSGFVTTPDGLVSEPILNTRSAEAIVRVADGQAAVIGGLRGSRRTEDLAKVPLLGDIPLLGALFRSTTQTRAQTELVIVLFPRVLTPAWIDEDVTRGIERTVDARVPFRRLTLPLEEPAASWREPALSGAPARGDGREHDVHGSAAPPPASHGISRRGLARLALARARQAMASHDAGEAAYQLEQALALDDSDAHAWILAGTQARRRQGEAAARHALLRALRLDPDSVAALNNLGLLELAAGNPVAAEGLFAHAVRASQDALAPAHNNLGLAHLQQGRTDAARAAFSRALALDPSLREAHLNLGVAADRAGDVAGAATAYRRFLLAGGDVNDPRLRALRARMTTLATHWQEP
jgi:MSHA biogenesis protein MshL